MLPTVTHGLSAVQLSFYYTFHQLIQALSFQKYIAMQKTQVATQFQAQEDRIKLKFNDGALVLLNLTIS